MEFCEEDVEYLRYFKVALAIAIIRQKSENLTAKQYTEKLFAILREKEQNSNQKVQHLQSELFQTKQTLIQSQSLVSRVEVDAHNEPDETKPNTDDEVDNILLTPPASSEDNKTNKESSHLLRNAQFLKSVSFMCKKPYKLFSVFAGDDVIVVKETLLQIIKMLTQDSGSKIMALPQNILQACADGIIDILECPGLKNYQSELKVPTLILVEHLIQMIMKVNVNTHQLKDKISKILVIFGCTPSLRNEILTKLATSILDVSSKLRQITQGRCSIRTFASEYHSIYHVLWAIETILTRTLSIVPRPGTGKTADEEENASACCAVVH
ncbi:meiosis-specific protein MEI4-like [Actinia tenebrosa]|uniref:Meiosis-specific protein MEI4-like n=1 Tax=Actinia tenebrosa TaxID=6105 RepID=A0A6P8H9C6_ACTTE|nr:meiosis-specific protein MEI4-like [Actinia tenebrosa]